jgi:hypothetical protein
MSESQELSPFQKYLQRNPNIVGFLKMIAPWPLGAYEVGQEIKTDLRVVEESRWRILNRYRSIGEKLNKAKEFIPHGSWTDWLKICFKMPVRKAERYMAYAKSDVTSDLEKEESKWQRICGNKPRPTNGKPRPTLPPEDDGSRQIDFPPAITDEEGEAAYYTRRDALMQLYKLDEGSLILLAIREMHDKDVTGIKDETMNPHGCGDAYDNENDSTH